jgi:hypothetical protein
MLNRQNSPRAGCSLSVLGSNAADFPPEHSRNQITSFPVNL